MTRRAVVPIELTRGPFTVDEARRAGLSRNQLESRCWRRLGPGTYVWTGLADGPALALAAVRQRMPFPVVFSGRTAGWLHGLDLAPCDPIEITVPAGCGTSGRVGILIRRALLPADEIVVRQGVQVTSILRTLGDLTARLSLAEAVVAVDSALRLELVSRGDLSAWTARRAGRKGVRRLRRVLELAEPASESPMETRLRMLLVLSGLPRPQVQAELRDAGGTFLAEPISTTPGGGWRSNTTEPPTGRACSRTTAGRTGCSTRATSCCALPAETCCARPRRSSARSASP